MKVAMVHGLQVTNLATLLTPTAKCSQLSFEHTQSAAVHGVEHYINLRCNVLVLLKMSAKGNSQLI
jgi:hypothetical protein